MRSNDHGLTRRDFFKRTSAGALAAGVGVGSASATRRIPIGVQLYCFRNELGQEFEGTMEAVAGVGFGAVEFADYFGRSAKQLRKVLDDNGLEPCGTHIMLGDMLGDNLKRTVEFNQELGNPNLIVRWLDEKYRKTPEDFDQTVGLFNEVSANLKPYGMKVGYHNHDYIFDRFNGKMLWNILADGTSRDVVLQLDTGNASQHEGVDVVELLSRNAGRTTSIHVKPYSSKDPAAYIADDELDWPTIIRLCQTTARTEWYIIEFEVPGIPPLEAIRENYKRFKALL